MSKRAPKDAGKATLAMPEDLRHSPDCVAWVDAAYSDGADLSARLSCGGPDEARLLAAWLLEAADWADAQAARRKGKA